MVPMRASAIMERSRVKTGGDGAEAAGDGDERAEEDRPEQDAGQGEAGAGEGRGEADQAAGGDGGHAVLLGHRADEALRLAERAADLADVGAGDGGERGPEAEGGPACGDAEGGEDDGVLEAVGDLVPEGAGRGAAAALDGDEAVEEIGEQAELDEGRGERARPRAAGAALRRNGPAAPAWRRARAARRAAAMPAAEMAFGLTPARARAAARRCMTARRREASGRRLARGASGRMTADCSAAARPSPRADAARNARLVSGSGEEHCSRH